MKYLAWSLFGLLILEVLASFIGGLWLTNHTLILHNPYPYAFVKYYSLLTPVIMGTLMGWLLSSAAVEIGKI